MTFYSLLSNVIQLVPFVFPFHPNVTLQSFTIYGERVIGSSRYFRALLGLPRALRHDVMFVLGLKSDYERH